MFMKSLNNKAIKTVAVVMMGMFLGWQLHSCVYEDVCLDLGGGKNPGKYPICVLDTPRP